MKIALIPCGGTEWEAAGRLLGRVELPLSPAGQEQCGQWVEALNALELKRILHAPDGLATQTAAYLSRQLSVPTKSLEDLSEVDIGLWAGLTESELKTRYASAHRQLSESPLSVSPPGGESLSTATKRLSACVRKQMKKKDSDGAIGIVMRPLSLAMTRCDLEGRELVDVWESTRQLSEPIVIDCSETTRRTGGKQAAAAGTD